MMEELDTNRGTLDSEGKALSARTTRKGDLLVIRHVLAAICTDHQGRIVAHEAHALAKQLGARLTVLHVLPKAAPSLLRPLDFDRTAREARLKADWFFDDLLRELHDPRVERELREAREHDVAEDVAQVAQALEADLIVVGTHAQVRPRMTFGQRLLRCTHLPVTLVGPALPTREPHVQPQLEVTHRAAPPSDVPLIGAATIGTV